MGLSWRLRPQDTKFTEVQLDPQQESCPCYVIDQNASTVALWLWWVGGFMVSWQEIGITKSQLFPRLPLFEWFLQRVHGSQFVQHCFWAHCRILLALTDTRCIPSVRARPPSGMNVSIMFSFSVDVVLRSSSHRTRSTSEQVCANFGTHNCKWKCSHRLQATSKGLHANC